jgi:hypothetical protein
LSVLGLRVVGNVELSSTESGKNIMTTALQDFAHNKYFKLYLKATPEIQEVIRDMIEVMDDPTTDKDDYDLALDTLNAAFQAIYD